MTISNGADVQFQIRRLVVGAMQRAIAERPSRARLGDCLQLDPTAGVLIAGQVPEILYDDNEAIRVLAQASGLVHRTIGSLCNSYVVAAAGLPDPATPTAELTFCPTIHPTNTTSRRDAQGMRFSHDFFAALLLENGTPLPDWANPEKNLAGQFRDVLASPDEYVVTGFVHPRHQWAKFLERTADRIWRGGRKFDQWLDMDGQQEPGLCAPEEVFDAEDIIFIGRLFRTTLLNIMLQEVETLADDVSRVEGSLAASCFGRILIGKLTATKKGFAHSVPTTIVDENLESLHHAQAEMTENAFVDLDEYHAAIDKFVELLPPALQRRGEWLKGMAHEFGITIFNCVPRVDQPQIEEFIESLLRTAPDVDRLPPKSDEAGRRELLMQLIRREHPIEVTQQMIDRGFSDGAAWAWRCLKAIQTVALQNGGIPYSLQSNTNTLSDILLYRLALDTVGMRDTFALSLNETTDAYLAFDEKFAAYIDFLMEIGRLPSEIIEAFGMSDGRRHNGGFRAAICEHNAETSASRILAERNLEDRLVTMYGGSRTANRGATYPFGQFGARRGNRPKRVIVTVQNGDYGYMVPGGLAPLHQSDRLPLATDLELERRKAAWQELEELSLMTFSEFRRLIWGEVGDFDPEELTSFDRFLGKATIFGFSGMLAERSRAAGRADKRPVRWCRAIKGSITYPISTGALMRDVGTGTGMLKYWDVGNQEKMRKWYREIDLFRAEVDFLGMSAARWHESAVQRRTSFVFPDGSMDAFFGELAADMAKARQVADDISEGNGPWNDEVERARISSANSMRELMYALLERSGHEGGPLHGSEENRLTILMLAKACMDCLNLTP